jgi:hypothetical protein
LAAAEKKEREEQAMETSQQFNQKKKGQKLEIGTFMIN